MRALAARCFIALNAAALSFLALSACMRQATPPTVPVDVTVVDLGDAGMRVTAPAARPGEGADRCTARLAPGAINTAPGCTLDERLTQGEGVLLYPCSGTGASEAVFGEHRFEGTMREGAVLLGLTTEIDWEDGCHWETKQSIRGVVLSEEGAKLGWTYSEGPVRGASCYGACKAVAEIVVVPRAP
jgi:hypothetical protein